MLEITSTHPPPDFSGESDADLIVYMALSGDDLNTSDNALVREAFAVFYKRHRSYLYNVLNRRHRKELERLHGPDGVAIHVNDTFLNAFKGAHTYREGPPGENPRRRTRAWLGRIAFNLLQNKKNARNEEAWPSNMDPDTLDRVPLRDPDPPSDSAKHQLICEALEQLTEREAYVMRMTLMYQEIGRQGERIPRDIVAEIARELATMPENVRKIRSRAWKKIRLYLEARE